MSSGPTLSSLQQSVRTLSRQPTRLITLSPRLPNLTSPQSPSLRLATLSRHFSTSRSDMAPATKEYDYIVIGGGSGGSGTARRAAGWYKQKTAIIEPLRAGGTCVNVGCVPKKMTWNAASIREAIHAGKPYGYSGGENVEFDFTTFVNKRDARIAKLNEIYTKNWKGDGIDLIDGTASFVSTNEVQVKPNDGSEPYNLKAKHITICTGGYPIKPKGIKGSEYGLTSDDYFLLKHLPKTMVFVGGGYIAVELAGVMNALGVETHLFIRGKTFLRKFDPMIQDTLTKQYEDNGVHVHREHPGIKEVIQLKAGKDISDPREKELKLIMEDGSELVTNELLWAIGRAPETRSLNLDKIGLKLGEKGHIIVDKYQNTSIDNIYAIGDITGQAELTPVAIAAGRALSGRLFGPPELKDDHFEYDRIPTVVFSHPPVGTTGLTQPEAEEKYGKENVKVFDTKFSAMYFDVFDPDEKAKHKTAYKMICQGPKEEVVGLHLLGEGSDEMIEGFGVAVKMGATRKDFQSTTNVHPTSSEEVTSL